MDRAAIVLLGTLLLGCPSSTGDPDDPIPPEPQAPGAMTIALSPDSPTSTDDLLVQVVTESVDPDGDLDTVRYSWTVDSVDQPDLAGVAGVSADRTSRGEVWAVQAVPIDATGLEGPTATADVTIGNSPPGIPTVVITPDEPMGGADALICEVTEDSEDVDGDFVTYSIEWTRNGESYPAAGDIGPVEALRPDDTVPADDSGPGQDWECRVTPTDGTDEGPFALASVSTTEAPLVPDWSLEDVNPTSASYEAVVSPRDYLEAVSGWYFGHAT